MTPQQWYESTIGKSIDTDGYPRSNPYQCWDDFDFFCRKIGFDGSRYCGSTGYVGDLWMLRDADGYHYYTAFDYIYDPAEFKTGDWIFWERHVAMLYEGKELGQNQPYPYVTLKEMNWSGILGAMRWKGWQVYKVPYGYSVLTINDHKYTLRRMTGRDKIGVLSAGLNQLAPIDKLDADVLVNAKIGGANYFQNDPDNPEGRPFGETYGDLSAPLNGVYQSLPMQDSTLFYDLDDGCFGDCTDVDVNSAHNVFSPSLVFPNSKGHWEYARMVGLSHKDWKSWYTFVVRFGDGYAVGLAGQEMTPQEIANDFMGTDMVNIAFLDGGGSAQGAFWHDGAMDYVRKTTRDIPSVVAIYRDFISEPRDAEIANNVRPEELEEVKTEKDEGVPMENEKPTANEIPQESHALTPVEGWTDPEAGKTTFKDRMIAMLSIKSLLTLSGNGVFLYLTVIGKIAPEVFMAVFSSEVAFYFGTTFTKNGK